MPQDELSLAEWSQEAEEDLREIFRYIAYQDRRPETARKVVHEIREHCDHYAQLSRAGNLMGTDRSNLGPNIRSLTHQRWIILFRPINGTVRVLAVFDGSREYAKLFEPRSEEKE